MLSHFPTETVTLKKSDGTMFEVLGLVQRGNFTTEDVSKSIDEGDTIERKLPNGRIETYTISEANYQQRFGSIPEMYSCTIRKVTPGGRQRLGHQEPRGISVTGPNARVNIVSGDHSTIADSSSYTATTSDASSEIEQEQWYRDLVEVLYMVVNAQDELEGEQEELRKALWKLTQVDPSQATTLRELQEAAASALSTSDKTKLAKIGETMSTVAVNVASSALWEQVIIPILGLA